MRGAATAERACNERIRQTWRIQAVDDDLLASFGRSVLVAGQDLRNIGVELKPVEAGPLDLNDRQYSVLRASREDVPPFVFQFTAPPTHPWAFRIFALRRDSLDALKGRSHALATERQAEAFTMALVMGTRFTTTRHSVSRWTPTGGPNRYPGPCMECGALVKEGAGMLLRRRNGKGYQSAHKGCVGTGASSVEVVLDDGEPAYWLGKFNDTLPSNDAWPDVILPRDYSHPPLRPAHVDVAAAYVWTSGMLIPEEPVIHRPDLRVVEGGMRRRPGLLRASGDLDRIVAEQSTDISDIAVTSMAELSGVDRHEVNPVQAADAARAFSEVVTERHRALWLDARALVWSQRHAESVVRTGAPGPFGGREARRDYQEWIRGRGF